MTITQSRRLITRSKWLIALVLTFAALCLAACGTTASSPATGSVSTQHITFAKTKFVIHAGLAFGAFHRYIYKPFRTGGFSPPASHKLALAKAGAAALFAYHESKIALQDAQASPTLSKLVSPLTALQHELSRLGTKLKGGVLDSTGITSAASAVNNIGTQSAHDYKTIKDAPTPASADKPPTEAPPSH